MASDVQVLAAEGAGGKRRVSACGEIPSDTTTVALRIAVESSLHRYFDAMKAASSAARSDNNIK
jgi:hypothetical protein